MKALLACLFGLAALLVGGTVTATLAVLLTPLLFTACRLLVSGTNQPVRSGPARPRSWAAQKPH